MEKKETEIPDKNKNIFDFYSRIKEIISEYESDLDELDSKENNNEKKEDDRTELNNFNCIKKTNFCNSMRIIFIFHG